MIRKGDDNEFSRLAKGSQTGLDKGGREDEEEDIGIGHRIHAYWR